MKLFKITDLATKISKKQKITSPRQGEKLQEIFKRETAAKEVMMGFPNTLIPSRIGKDFLSKNKNLLIN